MTQLDDKDFLDEVIEKRTEQNPGFPALVRLAEIKAREAKATKGPWEARNGEYLTERVHINQSAAAGGEAVCYFYENMRGAVVNSQFVAHAREDIPWLIAALEEERQAVERLRELVADAVYYDDSFDAWFCPYCGNAGDQSEDVGHEDDCPAFGAVK